jgi:hypothetical protein
VYVANPRCMCRSYQIMHGGWWLHRLGWGVLLKGHEAACTLLWADKGWQITLLHHMHVDDDTARSDFVRVVC